MDVKHRIQLGNCRTDINSVTVTPIPGEDIYRADTTVLTADNTIFTADYNL